MPVHTGASPPSAAVFGEDIFEEVKRRVDLFDVARRLGIIDKKRQARCPYPDHRDSNPSFTLYRDTQTWHCFGCRRSGDAANLMRDFGGFANNYDAAKYLLGGVGALGAGSHMTPRSRRGFIRAAPVVKIPPKPPDAEALLVAAWHYHATLLGAGGADGREYLARRGVSAAAISDFGLGYCAGGGLRAALSSHGVKIGAAIGSGLFRMDNDEIRGERFEGCVVVPDWDAEGACRWLTGRRVSPSAGLARFESLPGNRSMLGARGLAGANIDALFVVEGVFDYLALRQWGYDVICFCGSPRLDEAVEGIHALAPGAVVLALDADEAGAEVTAQLLERLDPRAGGIELPLGVDDPADLLCVEGGEEAFGRAAAVALQGAVRRV